MAINPELITTIRVDQLAPATLDLTKLVPIAEVNGELKQSTIQDLADLIATTISASGGVGFLPLVVTNGQQLPDVPENPSFFLCGAGTYLNINGYPDVICTEALNAVVSLTDHWQLAVEIPIVAEVGVQTVTGSAVDNTDPLNPVINEIIDGVQTIVAGTNITVDNTDPSNPIISASGGGGSQTLQQVLDEGAVAEYDEGVNYFYASILNGSGANRGVSFICTNADGNGTLTVQPDASSMSGSGNELGSATMGYIAIQNGKIRIIQSEDLFDTELNFEEPIADTNWTVPAKTAGNYEFASLDDIPSTSTFVPYTGATQDVNLGEFDLYANKVWLYDAPNDNYGSLHFTDSDFHIEDADGHKMLVIEDGFVQLHKTDTIQSNLYTSGLTVTRDHYLPNESGTIALTSIVADTITNGVTDKAPSQNAVFDALALKQTDLFEFQTKQGFYFFEDFLGNQNSSAFNSLGVSTSATGTGAVCLPNTTYPNRTNQQGVMRMASGTSATGGVELRIGDGNAGAHYLGNGIYTMQYFVNIETLSDATNRFYNIIGANTGSNFANTNGIFFLYDEGGVGSYGAGSPNFKCITRNALTGTITTTSTVVTASQWYVFKIVINANASSVQFFIDNTLVATHTTNIPTLITPRIVHQKTVGTTSRNIFCDYMLVQQLYTTPRTI